MEKEESREQIRKPSLPQISLKELLSFQRAYRVDHFKITNLEQLVQLQGTYREQLLSLIPNMKLSEEAIKLFRERTQKIIDFYNDCTEKLMERCYKNTQDFQDALLRFWLAPHHSIVERAIVSLEAIDDILKGVFPETIEKASQEATVVCEKDLPSMENFLKNLLLSEGGKVALSKRFGNTQSKYSLEEYLSHKKEKGLWFLLKDIDGNTIGCCEAYPIDNENKEVDIAYIVHPDFQGRGYGRMLLSFALERLKKEGFSSISAMPTNPGSEQFFKGVVPNAEINGNHREDNRIITAAI